MQLFEVRVEAEDFDVSAELARLRSCDSGIGALASFVGIVRDLNDDKSVSTMTLEHYPGMTERSIDQILMQAKARWSVMGAVVVHRVGELRPSDQIVLVAIASAHRGDAFEACEFVMDYLKTQAPFWKKEETPQGARWVDARATDNQAAARWGNR